VGVILPDEVTKKSYPTLKAASKVRLRSPLTLSPALPYMPSVVLYGWDESLKDIRGELPYIEIPEIL
jgi:hypothetical protein